MSKQQGENGEFCYVGDIIVGVIADGTMMPLEPMAASEWDAYCRHEIANSQSIIDDWKHGA